MATLQHPDTPGATLPGPDLAGLVGSDKATTGAGDAHPSGRESYGRTMQILRGIAFAIYFNGSCIVIFITQCIGAPLYFLDRNWYYAYMAMTKRSFAIVTTSMTHIWGPTVMRISGDESVDQQIRPDGKGGVQLDFPERIVLIANHQIYTEWVYLWWIAYVNRPSMHGHIYIILKESLQWIPVIGWGMRFYSFIFMSRKMATDQPRLAYRLNKLQEKKVAPSGKEYLDPMWLLLFPEGTNLSNNGRRKSAAWAKKNDLRDPEHVMLPRSTGTFFCLNELKKSVDYVYDCTIAYEGVVRGKYGEEIFGLATTYLRGRPPKSVNLHWRRFRIADIPLDSQAAFDVWLRERWYEKDALIEEYLVKGRLPPMVNNKLPYVEAEVKTRYPWEILQVFTVVAIAGLIWNNVNKALKAAGRLVGM